MKHPLAERGRNDPCWCGKVDKYKRCHGSLRPSSLVGETLPADDEDAVWISPNTRMARDSYTPGRYDRIRYHEPTGQPEAKRTPYPEPLLELARDPHSSIEASITRLGQIRFEVLDSYGIRTADDVSRISASSFNNLAADMLDIALSASRALIQAKLSPDPPIVIFNRQEDPKNLIGRTLLWAHHITVPDRVFESIVRGQSLDQFKDRLIEMLDIKSYIKLGAIVPVPDMLAEAMTEEALLRETKLDLSDNYLTNWVRSQLLIEGPTAREVLMIAAKDELRPWHYLRAYARKIGNYDGGILFSKPFEGDYDPTHDYKPWISQTIDDAVGHYIQELNADLAVSNFFGGTLVNRSLFHARLLSHMGAPANPAQAALWTPAPFLADADPLELAKAATDSEAVADLRRRMSAAVTTTELKKRTAKNLVALDQELREEARQLPGKLKHSAGWTSLSAIMGLGTVVMGATNFDLLLIILGLGNIGKDLLPYFQERRKLKLDASWIYYSNQNPDQSANIR
jgi:hypothetical protein